MTTLRTATATSVRLAPFWCESASFTVANDRQGLGHPRPPRRLHESRVRKRFADALSAVNDKISSSPFAWIRTSSTATGGPGGPKVRGAWFGSWLHVMLVTLLV